MIVDDFEMVGCRLANDHEYTTSDNTQQMQLISAKM